VGLFSLKKPDYFSWHSGDEGQKAPETIFIKKLPILQYLVEKKILYIYKHPISFHAVALCPCCI
jgi:hypothetical protein